MTRGEGSLTLTKSRLSHLLRDSQISIRLLMGSPKFKGKTSRGRCFTIKSFRNITNLNNYQYLLLINKQRGECTFTRPLAGTGEIYSLLLNQITIKVEPRLKHRSIQVHDAIVINVPKSHCVKTVVSVLHNNEIRHYSREYENP